MTYAIYYQDCIEGMNQYVHTKSVDMVFADPPFGINFANRSDETYSRKKDRRVDGYKEIPKSDYEEFTFQWLNQIARVTKQDASIYIVSGWTNLHHILTPAIETFGWFLMNHVVWWYNQPLPTQKKFRAAHYHIPVFVKTAEAFKNNKHTFNTFNDDQPHHDVWTIKRNMKPKKWYIPNATKLPDELVERAILYSSNEGDLVLDPFIGNGTTPAMCIKHKRNFVGFEVNLEAQETIEYMMTKQQILKESKSKLESFFK